MTILRGNCCTGTLQTTSAKNMCLKGINSRKSGFHQCPCRTYCVVKDRCFVFSSQDPRFSARRSIDRCKCLDWKSFVYAIGEKLKEMAAPWMPTCHSGSSCHVGMSKWKDWSLQRHMAGWDKMIKFEGHRRASGP